MEKANSKIQLNEPERNESYAIVQTSGKQFILQPGHWYDIDFIKPAKLGDFLYFNKILLFKKETTIQLGTPFLNAAKLSAKILQKVQGKKVIVLKTKPKKKYTRTKGHRQMYTRVQIDG
jgi:large subunit ribosomal protein L21